MSRDRNGGSHRDEGQIADGLAYVCEHVDLVRAALERGPADGPVRLDVLLAALRAGEDPSALLENVHRALRAAQDALGIFGATRGVGSLSAGSVSVLTPPGVAADRPYEPVLLCPRADRPCARYAWPEPNSDDPVCQVSGAPLRRTTLAP
ncbi:hypothetical protein [Streptomyces chiangmaiensis]|uniref:Uncharacterized protein n=1 Tax=Streptomyces chiangmaiensis TaxID=766497 RepID=A0ABU7FY57_9ACTN|nr:hypothetical protein [Streptomyces chiangmaiensis]MED7829056.1 hypothetical protein [Streptomyces chiangmaiensis]